MNFIRKIAEIAPLFTGADYFDAKTAVGNVSFNLIRPFHHLVVGQMVRAGVARKRSSTSGC
jgi:hypothetical protein